MVVWDVAITWYWGLAQLLAQSGIDIDVINAFHPAPELIAEFEQWEARNE